jgi:16S rRNA G966 N2-methylase RsmD
LPDKILRFPKINNIIPDYSLIRMSSTGKYSISRLEDSLLTTNEIINFYNNIILNKDNFKNITITDATANAGGNTINFALNNLNVNSIELSINEYYRLKNNIDLYKNFTKNVKVFNADCLDLIYNKKIYQDIIYFDPPWGGPSYKNYKNLGLSLDDKDIVDHIDNLLENKYCSLIVLKGPYNTFIKSHKYLNYVIKFKLNIDKSSSKKYKDYYNLYFFSLIDQKKVTDYFNKLPLNKDEIINVNPYNENKNETINRQIEYILEDKSLLNKNIVNKIYIIKSNIRGTELSINKILEDGTEIPNRGYGSYKYVFEKFKDNFLKN